MNKLYLEDLKEMNENEIKQHLKNEYLGLDYYGNKECKYTENDVDEFEIIIAYESVGSWGCDSSSFFLLKKGCIFYEIHASHCSCHGFEGQFDPTETSLKYLQSNHFNFYCGGYDDNETENQKKVKEFLMKDLIEITT